MHKRWVLCLLFFMVFCGQAVVAGDSPTFEQRVKAQEAIERVYYGHRIWPKENPQPKPPFEQLVSRSAIEAKVTDYLKKSTVLEQFWHKPVTEGQLQAELERMAKDTKDPETLIELFGALHNDPGLIAECLARPILTDRLIHNLYAYDTRLHAGVREQAERAMREAGQGSLASSSNGEYMRVRYELLGAGKTAREDAVARLNGPRVVELDAEAWRQMWVQTPAEGQLSDVEESEEAFSFSRTLSKDEKTIEIESLVFRKKSFGEWWAARAGETSAASPAAFGIEYALPAVPSPLAACTSEWKATNLTGAPSARYSHTAVWTGVEMIIWGGAIGGGPGLNSGGRYTPATDSWVATSTAGDCPTPRYDHTAIWTGTEMIVWGGDQYNGGWQYFNTGGRYNPATDSWAATSTGTDCPTARTLHTTIWTGNVMIVWGGYYAPTYTSLNTGGRYNPATDAWAATSTAGNCPSGRYYPSAVWTGGEMIIWGGGAYPAYYNNGGRYNPTTDAWTPVSTGANCPSGRRRQSAIWTGSEMIVWGGEDNNGALGTGGRYSTSGDSWTATSIGTNCPSARSGQTAVWTGSEMIIWGNAYNSNTGGRYYPPTDCWLATATDANCPSWRSWNSAVWTGYAMIIWGGMDSNAMQTGGIYTPNPLVLGAGSGCAGEAVSLSTGNYSGYQWVKDGVEIVGATSQNYAATQDGSYTVRVPRWDGCTAESSPHSVTFDLVAPTVEGSATGCVSPGVLLSTQPFSTYQWAKDSADISGATLQSFTATQSGSYAVRVTDAMGCMATSPGVAVTVNANPAPTVTGASAGCQAPGVTLSTGSFAAYQWIKDTVDIPSATLQSYTATASGSYAVRVTDGNGCSGTSAGFPVTVLMNPSPEIVGAASNTCPATAVDLSTGSFATYQWNYNGAPISGATSQTYQAWVSGAYTVTVVDGGGCQGSSSPFVVTIDPCAAPCQGWTWANPKPDGNSFFSVAFGNGKYVAVGRYGKIAASLDGATWAVQSSGTMRDLWGIAWSGSLFVAVGFDGTILTSADGLSWTARSSGTSQGLYSVAWLNGRFIASGSGRTILTSPNGMTWTIRNSQAASSDYLSGIAWSGSLYVVVGGDWSSYPPYTSLVLTSTDTVTWNTQTLTYAPTYGFDPGSYWLNAVAWNGSYFLAAGDNGLTLTSSDGLSWNEQNSDNSYPSVQSLLWNGSEFIAPDYGGYGIFSNASGVNWTQLDVTPAVTLPLWGICMSDGPALYVAAGLGSATASDPSIWANHPPGGEAENNLYGVAGGDASTGKPSVAVGQDINTGDPIILTSADGISWARNGYAGYHWLYDVAYAGGIYVAVGSNGSAYSSDGANWSEVSIAGMFYGVAGSGSQFVAVGSLGKIIVSNNGGASWNQMTSPTTQRLRGVTYDATAGLWVAVGYAGTILTSPEGVNWTQRTSGTANNLFAVTSGSWTFSSGESIHRIVAVGGGGTILTSSDGTTWTSQVSGTTATLYGVVRGFGQFEAVGGGGVVLSSADGTTWSLETSGTSYYPLLAVGHGAPGRYFTTGYYGTLLYKEALRSTATATPPSGSVPLLVNFSPAIQGGQSPYTYDWDFGDGSPHSNAQSPSHRYQAAGTYGITLTARDCEGMVVMDKLVVTAGGGNVFRVPYSVTPLKISTTNNGASGVLAWDASNCASDGYHIVYGYGSGLASWSVAGGACGLGTSGTAAWSNIPDPSADGSRFLWFIVVGDNGINVEGSWGTGTSGEERGNGASGVCGMTTKASGDCGTYPQIAVSESSPGIGPSRR